MSELVVTRVKAFAESLLPSMGLELVDIQFRPEGHGWVLRLFIDRPEGVSLDDCSRVSREVGDFLDVEDLIIHAYHLEVSSPGLERVLRDIDDVRRQIGKKAKIKLREDVAGQRVLIGQITGVDGQTVGLVLEDGMECRVAWDQIRKARLSL